MPEEEPQEQPSETPLQQSEPEAQLQPQEEAVRADSVDIVVDDDDTLLEEEYVSISITEGQSLRVRKDRAYIVDRLVQQGVREGTLLRSDLLGEVLNEVQVEAEEEEKEIEGVRALRRRIKRERDRINRGRLQDVLAQAPGGGDGRDLDQFIHSIIDGSQPEDDPKFTWPSRASTVATTMFGRTSVPKVEINSQPASLRSKASTDDDPSQRGWKRHQKRLKMAVPIEQWKAKSRKWWDPRRGKLLDEEGRIRRGASYVTDAFQRREAVNRPEWARNIYYVSQSKLWVFFHCVVLFVHMALAWFEPSSFRSYTDTEYVRTLMWIELSCIIVHWIDLILRFLHLGPWFFAHKAWNRMAILVILVLTADIVLALVLPGGLSFRFSRFLRPLLVLGRSKQLMDTSEAIIRTLPALRNLVLFLLFVVVFYAVIGTFLFPIGTYPTSTDPTISMTNFNNIGNAILSMFVLLTTENYPLIMYPTLARSDWFFVFFVSFLVVGVFVLLTVAVAIVFHTYKWHRRNTVLEDRIKEREALELAFQYLDINGDGKIDKPIFSKLIDILAPSRPSFEVELMFVACDEDKDGHLTIYEFFSVCDSLLLRFTPEPGDVSILPPVCAAWFSKCAHRKTMQAMVQSVWFRRTSLFISIIHLIILCLVGIPAQTPDWITGLMAGNMAVNVVYLIEFGLQVLGLGSVLVFRDAWIVFDVVILVPSMISHIILLSLDLAFLPMLSVGVVGQLLRGITVLPVLRIVGRFKPFKSLLFTLAHVAPAILSMTIEVLVLFYIWGIIGMEILAQTLSAYPPYVGNPANFDVMSSAFVTLFQLLTLSNWHEVLYAAMASVGYDAKGWGVAVFLASFVMLVVLVFLNLLMSLIIEAFVALKEMLRAEEEEFVEVEDTLVDSFYQAQKKKLKLRVTKDRRGMDDVEAEVAARESGPAINVEASPKSPHDGAIGEQLHNVMRRGSITPHVDEDRRASLEPDDTIELAVVTEPQEIPAEAPPWSVAATDTNVTLSPPIKSFPANTEELKAYQQLRGLEETPKRRGTFTEIQTMMVEESHEAQHVTAPAVLVRDESKIKCRGCESERLVKKDVAADGKQRYQCLDCGLSFRE